MTLLTANSALVHTIFVPLLLKFRTKAPGAQIIAHFVGHHFGLVTHVPPPPLDPSLSISLASSFYPTTYVLLTAHAIINRVLAEVQYLHV